MLVRNAVTCSSLNERVGQVMLVTVQVGLDRTIYIDTVITVIFCRDFIKCTVTHGVHIQF